MAQTSIGVDVEMIQRLFAEADGQRRLLAAICQAAMSQEVAAHVGADMRGMTCDCNIEAAQRLRMMVQFSQHQASLVMGIDIVGT